MSQNKPLFRSEALQYYAQKHSEAVLPRFVSPLIFFCLWVALALLGSAGLTVWIIWNRLEMTCDVASSAASTHVLPNYKKGCK